MILLYLAIINVATFLVYRADKRKAQRGAWRTSERTLLLLAALGGSIGAEAAMHIYRHKTQHPQFRYGVPAIIVLQLLLAIWLS